MRSCRGENSDQARFCQRCGAPLETAEPGQEQRKVVTVVFTDVTGSTSLGERLDPESLRKVMSRYFDAMRDVIERHGGTVEKFIGDAVMAVFGIRVRGRSVVPVCCPDRDHSVSPWRTNHRAIRGA